MYGTGQVKTSATRSSIRLAQPNSCKVADAICHMRINREPYLDFAVANAAHKDPFLLTLALGRCEVYTQIVPRRPSATLKRGLNALCGFGSLLSARYRSSSSGL